MPAPRIISTASAASTIVYDAAASWSSQPMNDVDEVIIRNGATVTVSGGAGPELVTNGSFEPSDSPDIAFNGIASYAAGNGSLTGWTIANTSVWLIDGWNRFGNEANTVASDGDQYLQLQDSGTGVATISQNITTEVGATYQLTFDYSGVDTTTHSVELAYAAGGSAGSVTYSTGTPMEDWQTETVSFQATATTTAISFTGDSVGGGFYGVGIDNVSVTKTAEPQLIVNGSFETPAITPSTFSAKAAENSDITGWTISDTGVVLIDSFDNFGAWAEPAEGSDGAQFLQLQTHAGGPGTVSQSFSTTAGEAYRLTFDYSGIWPGSKATSFTYDIGGGDQTVNLSISGNQLPWGTKTNDFVATSGTSTLSFTGKMEAGFWGSSIDNVSVVRVRGSSDTADTLVVNDEASPTTATLTLDEAFDLTVTTSVDLGDGTGAGFVNQSTGTLTTATLTVNSSGTGDTSQYNLSGGSLEATATVVNNAGELNFTGGAMKSDGTIAINSGGTFTVNRSDTLTQGTDFGGGGISGAGAVETLGSGTLVLNAANTYTGTTDVNGGVLELAGSLSSGGLVTIDGATMSITGSGINRIGGGSGRAFTLQNGGALSDDGDAGTLQSINTVTFTDGGTLTGANASPNGTYGNFHFANGINVTGSGLATISAPKVSFAWSKTVTVADSVAGAGTDLLISSVILDDTRLGTLTKAGDGTLELTGTSTDPSTWSLSAGTLLVNGSYAGPATVNSSATLGGTGSIGGLATANSGGHLAPGTNGAGTLTLSGGLTLNNGAILDIEVDTVGANDDLIDVTGGTLTGAASDDGVTVNVTLSGTPSGSVTITLIDWSAPASASGVELADFNLVANQVGGYRGTLQIVGSELQLSVATIPGSMFKFR
ncbi:MAG: DUF642 domain-containing protein [Verrucomicrobia bacterium]|nr:DUF642 domain-containing protein [Verrucomicrobiota bacterium]